MAVERFNEAEKFLIQNWQRAGQVKDSLKAAQSKYGKLCDLLIGEVKRSHRELDWSDNSVTSDGSISVGRKRWKVKDDHGYIGVESLDLESLSDDDPESRPFIGIWTGEQNKPLTDADGVKKIFSAAEELLPKDEFARCGCEKWDPDEGVAQYQLWYYLPEQREELIKMIVEARGHRFVECLVGHFNVFAKLIPVLDDVFSNHDDGA